VFSQVPSQCHETETMKGCIVLQTVLVLPSCAVICHGLVTALHLNRELGEMRNFQDTNTGLRVEVYFEKKGVKSALVKPENLRVFELPRSYE